MKKYIFFGALLAAIAASLLIGAQVVINGMQDDITYEETVLFGSKACCEGVKVNSKISSDYYTMNWNTDFEIGGAEGKTVKNNSEFTWNPKGRERYYDFNNPVSIVCRPEGSHFFGGISQVEHKMIQDALAQTKDKERNIVELALSDYYDYLPLTIDYGFGWTGLAPQKAVNHMKMPVSEHMILPITVDKSGEVTEYSFDTDFGVTTKSYADSKGIYLAFTSPVPDECNNIYYIPYTDGHDKLVQFDKMETRYRLSSAEKPIALQPSRDEKYLYLITRENGKPFLSILKNNAQMQQIKKIALPEENLTDTIDSMKEKDGALLIMYDYRNFVLVDKNHVAFTGTLAPTEKTEDAYYREKIFPRMLHSDIDFDGEKLVMVTENGTLAEKSTRYNFLLFVYTKDGAQYIGRYAPNCSYEYDNEDIGENFDGSSLTVTLPG